MRSNTLAALLLMLVCLAAGLAFLFVSVPERRSTKTVVAPPACVGLLTPDERSVSLRGRVTRSTTHAATAGSIGYVDLAVSLEDFELGSQATSSGAVATDFAAGGRAENIAFLDHGENALPSLKQGDCILATVRLRGWACGPACDAAGYVVSAYRVVD